MNCALTDAAPAAEELKALHEALVSDGSIQYPQRMLIDQVQYLYGMTTSADQRPGADAYERIETLENELGELTGLLERLVPTQHLELEEGRWALADLRPGLRTRILAVLH